MHGRAIESIRGKPGARYSVSIMQRNKKAHGMLNKDALPDVDMFMPTSKGESECCRITSLPRTV